jgi:hypothetical protein
VNASDSVPSRRIPSEVLVFIFPPLMFDFLPPPDQTSPEQQDSMSLLVNWLLF